LKRGDVVAGSEPCMRTDHHFVRAASRLGQEAGGAEK